LSAIELLEQMVQKGLHPNLTLLFDLDPGVGIERARNRAELDRFEEEALAFFERVRDGYLTRAKGNPRFVVIDAAQPVNAVQQALRETLEPYFGSEFHG
jgi:dTMP kinase